MSNQDKFAQLRDITRQMYDKDTNHHDFILTLGDHSHDLLSFLAKTYGQTENDFAYALLSKALVVTMQDNPLLDLAFKLGLDAPPKRG